MQNFEKPTLILLVIASCTVMSMSITQAQSGIGSISPRQALEIRGTALISQGGTLASPASGVVRIGQNNNLPIATLNRGVQTYFDSDWHYSGLRSITATRLNAVSVWGDGQEDDYQFIHFTGGNERTVMHLDGQSLDVGIGTDAPAGRLHLAKTGGTGTTNPTQLVIQNNSAGGGSQIQFIENTNSPATNSMRLRYNSNSAGFRNALEVTDGSGAVLTSIDAASGNMGVGGYSPTGAVGETKFTVDGAIRSRTGFPQFQLGDDEQIIGRFADQLAVVNYTQGSTLYLSDIHVFGDVPVAGIYRPTMAVDPNQVRVGIGNRIWDQNGPDATLHIIPANGDNALEIENMPFAPNGSYRRLLHNSFTNVVYRSRSNTNQNGFSASDGRLKNISAKLDGVLGRVEKLQTIVYQYKPESETGLDLDTVTVHYGVIAQEVQKVFPELVEESSEYLHVNYEELSIVLLEAVKELNAKNKDMEERMTRLELTLGRDHEVIDSNFKSTTGKK